ncbi:isopeptide-forming domain-containing fimbrial protein, partial [Listeria fleischmannii]|uniref:isopeptide-forming domain-containing fimbrial protein n=1 Tax=Listeria fleischmannii TaxID=1069827 RepID=UPI00162996C4
EQTAVKKIIDANGKLVDYADLKAGEAFQYRLDFNVPNTFKLDDLQLQDDLEDVLDLQGVHVLDANGDQDITEQGTLVLDEKKEAFTWTAKQPNTLAGHPIYVVVDAQVKDDADLTPYLNEENQVRIPNVGHMVINGKDLPTNEVNVSVPYKKEEKPVVKEKEMPQPKEAEKPLTVTTLPKTGTTGSGYGLLDFFTKWF